MAEGRRESVRRPSALRDSDAGMRHRIDSRDRARSPSGGVVSSVRDDSAMTAPAALNLWSIWAVTELDAVDSRDPPICRLRDRARAWAPIGSSAPLLVAMSLIWMAPTAARIFLLSIGAVLLLLSIIGLSAKAQYRMHLRAQLDLDRPHGALPSFVGVSVTAALVLYCGCCVLICATTLETHLFGVMIALMGSALIMAMLGFRADTGGVLTLRAAEQNWRHPTCPL
jgi:hypothetical protein